ncbi:unnamed protein product [Protopolystoma xenopodis]|uniref:Uncharacterized protein n=1 Tax=Protopolystoma xenopodis TaxID=117903 RepID=A0A3S5AAW0_9PLAT|nr:unnamed protein product [Protopolystoma xenopodis]
MQDLQQHITARPKNAASKQLTLGISPNIGRNHVGDHPSNVDSMASESCFQQHKPGVSSRLVQSDTLEHTEWARSSPSFYGAVDLDDEVSELTTGIDSWMWPETPDGLGLELNCVKTSAPCSHSFSLHRKDLQVVDVDTNEAFDLEVIEPKCDSV